jgi:hypothetical protein
MTGKRQARKQQMRRKQNQNRVIWGIIIVVVLGLVGFFVFSRPKAAVGEAVAVMPNTGHVPEGTDPGPYSTDPPTSGPHYAGELDPGFYDEGSQQPQFPAGYLVHNLEHGYVIFWYNCSQLSDQDCSSLKSQIQSVLDRENKFKVIAYPWDSIDVPVVMTSWGRMQKFESFDPEEAAAFVESNRNQAPEPNAP